uniref:PHD finger protein 24 n=1 Tax=Mus musculus TaxID=10090 RepID=S4R2C8_MOUSE
MGVLMSKRQTVEQVQKSLHQGFPRWLPAPHGLPPRGQCSGGD